MTVDIHRLEQLVIERAKLTNDRDALIERITELDSILVGYLPTGTHTLADHTLVITVPRRLDPNLLTAAYPVTQFPELYKPALDTASVKAHFAPVDLEQFKVDGRAQVRFTS